MENTLYFTENYNSVIISNNAEDFDEHNNVELEDWKALVAELMPYGYVIHPDVVMDKNAYNFIKNVFLKHIECNYNSTFYSAWNEIISKSRIELAFDQILHYLSTYGTNYQGESYIPNKEYITNNEFSLPVNLGQYKVIKVITEKEAFDNIVKIFNGSVALRKDLQDCLIDMMCSYITEYNVPISSEHIEKNIKNREVKVKLYSTFNIMPNDPVEFLRLLVYKCINTTELINSNEELTSIRNASRQIDLSQYVNTDVKYKKLASIYHRFHKIFLAFKYESATNSNVINKISRLAKKYHKPFQTKFLEKCLDWDYAVEMGKNLSVLSRDEEAKYTDELIESLKNNADINNFKAIKIYNACKERILNQNIYSYYKVRNGKVWLKTNKHFSDFPEYTSTRNIYYNIIKNVMYRYIKDNLSNYLSNNNIKYIKLDSVLDIAAPTSEKNFIGTLPEFSYIDLSKSPDNMIGVYWRNEWGTKDFDLSCISEDDTKIGWDSNYYNGNKDNDFIQIFSGDMTDADPEATEIHYFSNKNNQLKPCVFYNNRYNGLNNSKFKLFFAQCQPNLDTFNNSKAYMVDPKDILFETMMVSNKKEQVIGVVSENKYVFTDLQLSQRSVSGLSDDDFNYDVNNMIIGCVTEKAHSRLSLNDLLYAIAEDNDIKFVDENTPEDELKNISEDEMLNLNLKSINKDTLLEMFR